VSSNRETAREAEEPLAFCYILGRLSEDEARDSSGATFLTTAASRRWRSPRDELIDAYVRTSCRRAIGAGLETRFLVTPSGSGAWSSLAPCQARYRHAEAGGRPPAPAHRPLFWLGAAAGLACLAVLLSASRRRLEGDGGRAPVTRPLARPARQRGRAARETGRAQGTSHQTAAAGRRSSEDVPARVRPGAQRGGERRGRPPRPSRRARATGHSRPLRLDLEDCGRSAVDQPPAPVHASDDGSTWRSCRTADDAPGASLPCS